MKSLGISSNIKSVERSGASKVQGFAGVEPSVVRRGYLTQNDPSDPNGPTDRPRWMFTDDRGITRVLRPAPGMESSFQNNLPAAFNSGVTLGFAADRQPWTIGVSVGRDPSTGRLDFYAHSWVLGHHFGPRPHEIDPRLYP